VQALARLIERAGGRAAAERLAAERLEAGLAALRAAGLGGEALALCGELAGAAVGRVA